MHKVIYSTKCKLTWTRIHIDQQRVENEHLCKCKLEKKRRCFGSWSGCVWCGIPIDWMRFNLAMLTSGWLYMHKWITESGINDLTDDITISYISVTYHYNRLSHFVVVFYWRIISVSTGKIRLCRPHLSAFSYLWPLMMNRTIDTHLTIRSVSVDTPLKYNLCFGIAAVIYYCLLMCIDTWGLCSDTPNQHDMKVPRFYHEV